jgi:transcriptional regulator with XRE-family HTH domain
MATVRIGTIIATKRKEKGITQEELANHLGVSKPAVSKWESGQSYPDILLLPILASFFDITVDELIGYEPQMTKEEVRKLYHRFAEAFVKKPFEQVLTECEEYIKKYFSCWHLQFQMGLLLLNHATLAGSQERIIKIIEKALELFNRVAKASDDINLAKQSVQLQAICYLGLQQPIPAIDLLEPLHEPFIQTESVLVKAYQMKGDNTKAMEYLQGYVYFNLMVILDSASDFFSMYVNQPERMEKLYKIFEKVVDAFEVDQLNPGILWKIYLAAAQIYTMQGNKERALDILEAYLESIEKSDKGKFRLKGNAIFDVLEDYFKTIDLETSAPRQAEVVWMDIKKAVLQNPIFAVLEPEERFHRIKRRLESQ